LFTYALGIGAMTASSDLEVLYEDIFFREPDAGGTDYWQTQLRSQSFNSIAWQFMSSEEAQDSGYAIITLYQMVFGRVPDQEGFFYWKNIIDSSDSLEPLLSRLTTSDEFLSAHDPNDREGFVRLLYVNSLGREPDAQGLAYWVNSGLSFPELIQAFVTSEEWLEHASTKVTEFYQDMANGHQDWSGSLFDVDVPAIRGFGDDTGNPGDNVTSDTTITLNGTTRAGYTVHIFDGTNELGQVVADANGNWTYTTSPLDAGSHTLSAVAQDFLGNESSHSQPLAINVVPLIATPVVDGFTDDTGNPGDGITTDNTITLTGTTTPGSAVHVFDGNTDLGAATVDPNGNWTFTTNPLATGTHALTAVALDGDGNPSAPSEPTNLTIVAPVATPVVAGFSDDTGTPGDGITTDNTITLTGTTTPGSTVHVFDGNTDLGTATVDPNGNWTFTTDPLGTGAHALTAVALDADGNPSAPSEPTEITIVAPPATPEIVSFSDDTGVVGDNITSDNTITLTGTTTAPDSTVHIFDGTTDLGEAQLDGNGNWTFTTDPLATGTHELRAVAVDANGNQSAASQLTLEITNGDGITPVAHDDLTTATLNIVPATSVRTDSDSDSVLLNLGSFSETYSFLVGQGEVSDAHFTINVDALVGVLNTASAELQVQINGQWETVATSDGGNLLQLLGLGTNTADITLADLPAGNYQLVFTGGGLVGAGTTVTMNATYTDHSLTDVSGEPGPAVTGNVLTDVGTDGQPDVVGDAVLQVVDDQGNFVSATAAGTVVHGDYGTLTIHADGSYSYEVGSDLGAIGQVDSFQYQLYDPVTGETSTAELYVHIDSPQSATTWDSTDPSAPAAPLVDATNDTNTASISSEPLVTSTFEDNAIAFNWTAVAGIPVSGQTEGSSTFTVDANTQQDVTIQVASPALATLLTGIDVTVERQNSDGSWTAVADNSNGGLLQLVGLGNGSAEATVSDLGPGAYRVTVAAGGVLSLNSSISVDLTHDITHFDQHAVTAAEGNVLTGEGTTGGADTIGSDYTAFYLLDGAMHILPGQDGTVVDGQYGTLTVYANGEYVYQPDGDLTAVGHNDVFTYELVHPSGETDTATLTISIGEGTVEPALVGITQPTDHLLPIS